MSKTLAEAIEATRPKLQTTPSTSAIDADRIKAILEQKGVKTNSVDNVVIGAGDALFDSLSPAQKKQIQAIMDKLGYPAQGKNELKTNLATYYQTIYDSSSNFAQLYSQLKADLLPGDSSGADKYAPQRTVPGYDPIAIKAWVDGIYQKTLGRKATEQELQDRFDEVKPLLEFGTLSTPKKVYNPQTGKTEIVTTTETGFNQAAEEKTIEEKLKLLNPDDYDRQQRIGFADWLSQNVQGA